MSILLLPSSTRTSAIINADPQMITTPSALDKLSLIMNFSWLLLLIVVVLILFNILISLLSLATDMIESRTILRMWFTSFILLFVLLLLLVLFIFDVSLFIEFSVEIRFFNSILHKARGWFA